MYIDSFRDIVVRQSIELLLFCSHQQSVNKPSSAPDKLLDESESTDTVHLSAEEEHD